MRAARVFISCGQESKRERKIGEAVELHFRNRGFLTFLASKAHSPEGLTEHIFKYLRESEYFVFVDPKRQALSETDHRGSLFVNQELAIATFLGIPGIGFVEEGVRREGVSQFQILNASTFERCAEVLEGLKRNTAHWNCDSVQELRLRYDPDATTRDIPLGSGDRLSDWYHLEVANRHREKHALECMGYLTKLEQLGTGRQYPLPSNELLWAGIADVRANIIAGGKRDLDTFYVVEGNDRLVFHQRKIVTDNPRYNLPQLRLGSYIVEFSVISNNFAVVAQRFGLQFGGTRESVSFKPME